MIDMIDMIDMRSPCYNDQTPQKLEEFYSAVDEGATHLLRDYLNEGLNQPPLIKYALKTAIKKQNPDISLAVFEYNWQDPLLVLPSLCLQAAMLLKNPTYLTKFLNKQTYTAQDLAIALSTFENQPELIKDCLRKTPPQYLKYINEIEWNKHESIKFQAVIKISKEVLTEVKTSTCIKKLKEIGVGARQEKSIDI